MVHIGRTPAALVVLVLIFVSLPSLPASGQTSPGSGPSGGRIASAQGKEVRIMAMDGSRQTGTLVSLSASDVVFRRNGKDISIPLGQVRRIEKVSHNLRNGALLGLGLGVVAGVTPGFNAYRGDLGYELGTLVDAGVFAGIGAGIGAIVKFATARNNVLYQVPATSTSSRAASD